MHLWLAYLLYLYFSSFFFFAENNVGPPRSRSGTLSAEGQVWGKKDTQCFHRKKIKKITVRILRHIIHIKNGHLFFQVQVCVLLVFLWFSSIVFWCRLEVNYFYTSRQNMKMTSGILLLQSQQWIAKKKWFQRNNLEFYEFT